jgi:hypothetical protein
MAMKAVAAMRAKNRNHIVVKEKQVNVKTNQAASPGSQVV